MTLSTTLIERPANSQPEQILITVTPQVIQETIDGMMLLKIEGVDDKQGRELVSTARKQVVKLRTTAEKERVAIKEQALEECRRIDAKWKELFSLIEPVENYLKLEEKKIADIEKKLEESKLAEIRNAREISLENIGFEPTKFRDALITWGDLAKLTDDQFNKVRLEAAELIKAQREREEELAKMKAEREELELKRREFEKAQQELNQRQLDLDSAERKRRQAEADARLREQQKQLADKLKPDHERLLGVIDQLSQIEIPEVSAEAQYAKAQITNALQTAYDQVTQVLNGMVV